ncbi:L-ascorbate peroxidase, cytosolic-like [Rutidosis leptorrhynchoides]|uniref:L-ascorbate peroxidase, cytosolic-like n=1 Tax=Rutidosis leptorrhynchoides TaxID=125765 RepID=UPI003A98FC9E
MGPKFEVLVATSWSLGSSLLGFLSDIILTLSSSKRWHPAGTYDVKTKTGGPFGTMILYGDLYQILVFTTNGVAVEITGRPDVPFHLEREDKEEPELKVVFLMQLRFSVFNFYKFYIDIDIGNDHVFIDFSLICEMK